MELILLIVMLCVAGSAASRVMEWFNVALEWTMDRLDDAYDWTKSKLVKRQIKNGDQHG